ncbi:hypothetical protein AZA_35680 [Nitrospirillum viridazoti Y2]|nr:hypothetical protein AZA_35680 [Nitrospirillum amazonense Y2]
MSPVTCPDRRRTRPFDGLRMAEARPRVPGNNVYHCIMFKVVSERFPLLDS